MSYCAKERHQWKARIVSWAEELPPLIKRPVRKLIMETLAGILSSGSLQLSSIARQLKEPTELHHTLKRLSRMLGKHDDVSWACEELLLNKLAPEVTDAMIVAIDPGDLNRDGALKSEYLGKVRDGSTGDIVNGYPLISVVARDVKTGRSLPLLTRLLSSRRHAFKSENTDILNAMETVQQHLSSRPLWVIDRGGDRGVLWDTWLKDDCQILVRAANKRYWRWRGGLHTAQQIAKNMPLKHEGKLTRQGKDRVRFGITRVQLREHPDKPLSMVVVRHGKQQPLVLVTTREVRGRRQGEQLMQAYMDRWACEEGYRFSKQGFGLEKVQSRKLTSLQNLVALATLAWGLLAYYQHQGQRLLQRAKRQKPKQTLQFPFYSLLQGWQQLFAQARTLFYDWFRAPARGSDPPIRDLFPTSVI